MAFTKDDRLARVVINVRPDNTLDIELWERSVITDDETGDVFLGNPAVVTPDRLKELAADKRSAIRGRLSSLVARVNQALNETPA